MQKSKALPSLSVRIDLDPEGRIVLVNAQAEKTFGYAREDLLGQSMEILVPERLREKCKQLRMAFFRDPDRNLLALMCELRRDQSSAQ